MDHAEKARALFLEGYNCAQAVFCAFEDLTGLDRETSARLASSFGGGMGRMREVCGTVSGARDDHLQRAVKRRKDKTRE